MTKPQSYPFLAIANAFGLPYGDVLSYADWLRGYGTADLNEQAQRGYETFPPRVKDEISSANTHFNLIQAGKIDWQTGGPRYDHEPRCDCGHLFEICNGPNCNGDPEPGEHYSENYDLARFKRGEPNE